MTGQDAGYRRVSTTIRGDIHLPGKYAGCRRVSTTIRGDIHLPGKYAGCRLVSDTEKERLTFCGVSLCFNKQNRKTLEICSQFQGLTGVNQTGAS